MVARPHPTVLDFANVAGAAYGPAFGGPVSPTAPGGWSILPSTPSITKVGFKGAIYSRGGDLIAAFCGTEGAADGGNDIISDLGFGSRRARQVAAVMAVAPPILYLPQLAAALLNTAATVGDAFLSRQSASAIDMANLAKTVATQAGGRRAYITGHSLGGGLAQIAAAHTGLRAVTFNPAPASNVRGIAALYARQGGAVVNFLVQGDPINGTRAVGDWLGDCIMLASTTRGNMADAHRLGPTIDELTFGGFQGIGRMNPFWFIGRGGFTVQPNSGRPG
jgi:hypothetical protein